MKRTTALLAAILFCVAGVVYADYTFTNRGEWPKSWPGELEGLRMQSRTLAGPMVLLLHHGIPFTEREAFEEAWPHLLKVKTHGAPIVLKRGPSFWLGGGDAGVCIHTPPAGVTPVADAKEAGGRRERMIYIELIVDGDIVDLNRIPLPPDTPMIDERFKDRQSKSPNRNGD
jgi:hypothetical protein